MGNVVTCGSCGSPELYPILDMGEQPLAERYDADIRYPLALLRCNACTLVQLSHIPPQEDMFPSDHPYATGNSAALRSHFARLTSEIFRETEFSSGDYVVDIGANDGTLLRHLAQHPLLRTVAVEPTNQAAKCRDSGMRTWQRFFSPAVAEDIAGVMQRRAKVVVTTNVLAHVPNVHEFLRGVTELLAPDGVFITENHDFRSIREDLQYDTVYHEHLRYYTPASLSHLLDYHGLDVRRIDPIPTHGGSFRTWASLAALQSLGGRVRIAAEQLRVLLGSLEGPVYGISAATRATPLLHYAGIADYIERVCEVAGSEKIGRCMPGTSIPIVDEAQLTEDQPPYALLFCWHMKDIVVPALRSKGYRGKFIVPLPEPEIIDG